MCGAEETSTQAAGFVCLGWGFPKIGGTPNGWFKFHGESQSKVYFMENPSING